MACSTLGLGKPEFDGSPYFEASPSDILFSDKETFNQALNLQYKGQLKFAIDLWQKFLAEHVRSFEALNNLGMAFYSNDQIDKAILSFYSALDLEPESKRIKKNLRRTLRFRITLAKENKDYHPAIRDLEKVSSLSSDKDKEKILQEIEDIQEKIFSEVKRVNTAAEYESFLQEYPSGIYADKARERLKLLAPEVAKGELEKTNEFLPALIPRSTKLGEEIVSPASKKEFGSQESRVKNTSEEQLASKPSFLETGSSRQPTADSLKTIESKEVPLQKKEFSDEPATDFLTMIAPKEGLFDKIEPPIDLSVKVVKEQQPELKKKLPVQALAKVRKIRVTTKKSVLNIRSKPSLKGKVVGKLKRGAAVMLLEETTDWYRIVYSAGKDGWVSRRYSKEIR